MYTSEIINVNPKYEDFVREILIKHEQEIITLVEDLTKSLGEGNTANVRFLGSCKEVCLKIFKMTDEIGDTIFYLSPEKEKEFLQDLSDLDAKVRVPDVYASFQATDDDGTTHQFLMMENLPAVSIDDVLQDRAELPADFDVSALQDDLFEFVEKMHERQIYHRDLHEGNIMIDRQTRQPYVIDFGASIEFLGTVYPGEPGPYHITKDAVERIVTSDESMVKAVMRKLRTKLTKVN